MAFFDHFDARQAILSLWIRFHFVYYETNLNEKKKRIHQMQSTRMHQMYVCACAWMQAAKIKWCVRGCVIKPLWDLWMCMCVFYFSAVISFYRCYGYCYLSFWIDMVRHSRRIIENRNNWQLCGVWHIKTVVMCNVNHFVFIKS